VEHLTQWESMNSLRLKATNRCAWNCWWCHNEGSGPRRLHQAGDVNWDTETRFAIQAIASELKCDEIHLTGGEPFLQPRLPQLIHGLRTLDLKVKATSIGCKESELGAAVAAGLTSINFSLHAIDPLILQATQIDRGFEWVRQQLAQLLRAVMAAQKLGVEVKLNTVLASSEDAPRVRGVLDWAQRARIPLRIMNEFSSGSKSNSAIERFLAELGAERLFDKCIRGSSSFSTIYRLPDGYDLAFKQARDNYLDRSMCSKCAVRRSGRCAERFYGVRLERRRLGEKWQLVVRLCIHRTDEDTVMPVERFLRSPQLFEIKEIIGLAQDAADDFTHSASQCHDPVLGRRCHPVFFNPVRELIHLSRSE